MLLPIFPAFFTSLASYSLGLTLQHSTHWKEDPVARPTPKGCPTTRLSPTRVSRPFVCSRRNPGHPPHRRSSSPPSPFQAKAQENTNESPQTVVASLTSEIAVGIGASSAGGLEEIRCCLGLALSSLTLVPSTLTSTPPAGPTVDGLQTNIASAFGLQAGPGVLLLPPGVLGSWIPTLGAPGLNWRVGFKPVLSDTRHTCRRRILTTLQRFPEGQGDNQHFRHWNQDQVGATPSAASFLLEVFPKKVGGGFMEGSVVLAFGTEVKLERWRDFGKAKET
ncbi:hypothetical protein GALMADRAFT_212107 [Galerina marginata CBS 339.88]|uniref:Uncharacterized protein n=1 Tax=Galerina marginata (strain CBS 339.88) TaxID=685588 RepID=A0A067SSJ9_GALM3|nr:hypothetical protein GALMADRAFT_212107 [Galerina marginata CBS 339.88]